MEGCFRLEPVVTHALGCCSARPASAHFKWNAYSDEDWEGFSDFNPDDSVPDKPEECASVLNPPPNHRLFTTNYATKENLLADLHEFCLRRHASLSPRSAVATTSRTLGLLESTSPEARFEAKEGIHASLPLPQLVVFRRAPRRHCLLMAKGRGGLSSRLAVRATTASCSTP